MFWSKKTNNKDSDSVNGEKLPGPKNIVDIAASHIVVTKKKDPDWVWKLKSVIHPIAKKQFYCRGFDENQVTQAGINVKDWTSLDGHPELILWEGYCDQGTMTVRDEKLARQ